MLNINQIIIGSQVDGPGRRITIFFQGCNIGCYGCFNKEMIPFEKKNLLSVEELFNIVVENDNNIEGLTILGGEPTLQNDLITFLKKVKSDTKLGVILFTGKSVCEISKDYLYITDTIIDGEFNINLVRSNKFVGSENQNIIFNTDRYKEYDFKSLSSVEVILDDKIVIHGSI